MKKIEDFIRFSVNLDYSTFNLFKDKLEIFVEIKIINQKKRDEYLEQLKSISIEQGVYYASYPGIDEEETIINNRKEEEIAFRNGTEEMLRFLLKLKAFLNSGLNKKQKEEIKPIISAGTHIQAGRDIIIGNNNKNTINKIDKFLDSINKSNLDNKSEIIKLLEEFKKSNDRNKLVDVFSILGNGASISSMIIALSSLIK